MKVVGLISGGKDSCYNMMQCVAAGHTIVALANIQPSGKDELDSYMYQTVGHQGISIIADAMELPLFRGITKGNALEKGKMYQQTINDEVEDLFDLLQKVKDEIHIEGVAVGAILSDYQRVRVENVCSRLGLVSLAYLWRRDQIELLQEMIDCQVYAIVIKVAALGLEPNALGRPLQVLQPQLLRAKDKFGLNVCGEGGEYETFTLDCPLFKKRIAVDETQIVIHSNDPIAPCGYMNLLKLHLEDKPEDTDVSNGAACVKSSLDFISDLNESSYSDLSDLDLSETELDNTEEITIARRQSLSESAILNPLLDQPLARESANLSSTYSSPSVLVQSNNVINKESTNDELDSCIDDLEINKRLCLNKIESKYQRKNSLSTDPAAEQESQIIPRKKTNSKSYTSNPPSPIKYQCERVHIEDTSCIFANNSGWHWAGGIVGEGSGPAAAMDDAMAKLCNLLSSVDLTLTNVCAVTIYVRDMGEYAALNSAYIKSMSFPNPPARICVECPLPEGIGVIMEALAHMWPSKRTEDGVEEMLVKERHTMHVQGISHWAPANIGPYSQAVRVGDIINVAGQIPLVPGSMVLAAGGGRVQCRLALRHVQRLLHAMDANTQIRDVVQAICYLTHPSLIAEARRQWERRTNNAIVDYVVVPRLPRDAPLEWHVWAHRHNSRFEYEETGCNVGEYKVAIRRRWNYENNVAAVVCYVATGSSPSTSQLSFQNEDSLNQHKVLATQITEGEIIEILEYSFKKLLSDYRDEATVGLRVFYKVSISPDVRILIEALKKFRNLHLPNLAFTVIPVIHLQNAFTFLSISAIRHENE